MFAITGHFLPLLLVVLLGGVILLDAIPEDPDAPAPRRSRSPLRSGSALRAMAGRLSMEPHEAAVDAIHDAGAVETTRAHALAFLDATADLRPHTCQALHAAWHHASSYFIAPNDLPLRIATVTTYSKVIDQAPDPLLMDIADHITGEQWRVVDGVFAAIDTHLDEDQERRQAGAVEEILGRHRQ